MTNTYQNQAEWTKCHEATPEIKATLEELRASLRNENISYGEIAELQDLAEYIELGDTQLLEWANVPEQLTDREELEEEVLRVCSAENVYDLRDNMDGIPDQYLYDIIACDGDYEKELALMEGTK